jgi:hypothetical protein
MGAGSGAGAEITALNESLHAYACAARKTLGRPLSDIAEVKPSNVTSADCDRALSSTLKQLDADYFHSALTIANQIFVDYPFLKKGGYTFARGGEKVNKIYSAFNKLKVHTDISNVNKWNPADIWIIKDDLKINGDWTTLSDLNDFLLEQYHKGTLIGVSLKKLDKNGAAHAQVYNDGAKKSTANFTSFRIGANMFASKDVYIQFEAQRKPGEIQLRTFSSRPQPSSWQGEIKGKTAAGGKIGGGILLRACIECGIPSGSLLYPSSFTAYIDKPSDSKFREFATMYKDLTKSRDSINSLMSEAKDGQKQDKTWWMTKFLGVLADHKKEGKVTNWLYNYGSSATDDSSIFVKYS